MADQPKAMTLREAVEILVESAREEAERAATGLSGIDVYSMSDKRRALAIVGAAADAHEARHAYEDASTSIWTDGSEPVPIQDVWHTLNTAENKLRALERGEEA